jgi:hypothetical protein
MGKPILFAATVALIAASALVWTNAQAAGAAPSISGTPATVASTGTLYSFTPTAVDPERDTLVFSITGRPAWAYFNKTTGRLYGTPPSGSGGTYEQITIKVSDGTSTRALTPFSITVKTSTSGSESPSATERKAGYGHYFATRYQDTPADVAMLCEQHGIKGVLIRRAWIQLEPTQGNYDFSYIDQTLQAIAGSSNPNCQIWFMPEFKSFNASPVRHPAPAYLSDYQALNADGKASTLFMWEPYVADRYVALMSAIAARYDGNPRFEGFVVQESALGFNGTFSQDQGAGGTYTAAKWRDALIRYVSTCGNTFKQSRCMAFLNFLKGGQEYLHDVSAAISAVPDNRACLSGPDLLPDAKTLYSDGNGIYEVLARHRGCRANSAQNDSFEIYRFGLDQVFNFAVRGTFGDFDKTAPRASGVCVNSYLFWNHRVGASYTGLDWHDVLPVVAAYPYGPMWLDQCVGGGSAP